MEGFFVVAVKETCARTSNRAHPSPSSNLSPMNPNPALEVRTVLVLKADRLCASILQQTALKVFPHATVRLVSSCAAAITDLRAEPVDLLVTGIVFFDGDA